MLKKKFRSGMENWSIFMQKNEHDETRRCGFTQGPSGHREVETKFRILTFPRIELTISLEFLSLELRSKPHWEIVVIECTLKRKQQGRVMKSWLLSYR